MGKMGRFREKKKKQNLSNEKTFFLTSTLDRLKVKS